MDEYNKYAALADTIKIKDITSNRRKQSILQQIKDNDESFDKLWLCNGDQVIDDFDYDFDNAEELAWLGYFLGSNSTVKELYISSDLFNNSGKDVFRTGLGNNKSIHQLHLERLHVRSGQMFTMLDIFLRNNNNLTEIVLEGCEFGVEGMRQSSLALGGCNKSLQHLQLTDSNLQDGHLVDIITALSMHPQLTKLYFSYNGTSMGRNDCTALSTLVRCTTTQLEVLNLSDNNIDDVGMGLLLPALRGHTLRELNLISNRSITIIGWERLATLLEAPDSNLETLHIRDNNIGDEGALVFANKLVSNSTLKTLSLRNSGITREGWAPFSKLLCDASSVNKTYMSNHTIQKIRGSGAADAHVNKYLLLNKREDKQQVAMSKILQRHSHFDMEPFFEWEFKALPIMIQWFTNAARRVTTYDQKISRLKLSATFDFIKEFPMLYVEPITRKEIAEYTAMEEALEGAEHQGQLEEIQRSKTRAMRRL